MSKKRLSHGLLAATLILSASITPCFAARFTDTEGLWSERYINMLSDKGVIAAEPDGKFRAEEPVTRAIFASWLVNVLGLENQQVSGKPSYRDVKPTDWYYKPIEIIRQNNYISGFADGFRPMQLMQKAEAMTILARAININPPTGDSIDSALAVFTDKSQIPVWARPAIAQLMMTGVMVLPKQNELDPLQMLSRGDCAALMGKLSEFVTHQTIKDSTEGSAQQFQARVQQQAGGVGSMSSANGAPPQMGAPPQYLPPQNIGAPMPNNGAPYMPPPMQPLQLATVAKGTKLIISISNSLNSGSTQIGESVEGTVKKAYTSAGTEVIPVGSKVTGTVTGVVSARKSSNGRNGYVEVQFTELQLPNGRAIQISGSLTESQPTQGLGTMLGGGMGGMGMGGMGMNPMMGGMMGNPYGGMMGMNPMMGSGMMGQRRLPSEVGISAGKNVPMQLSDVLKVPVNEAQNFKGNTPNLPPQNYPPSNYQQTQFSQPGTGFGAPMQQQGNGAPPPQQQQPQQQ